MWIAQLIELIKPSRENDRYKYNAIGFLLAPGTKFKEEKLIFVLGSIFVHIFVFCFGFHSWSCTSNSDARRCRKK